MLGEAKLVFYSPWIVSSSLTNRHINKKRKQKQKQFINAPIAHHMRETYKEQLRMMTYNSGLYSIHNKKKQTNKQKTEKPNTFVEQWQNKRKWF